MSEAKGNSNVRVAVRVRPFSEREIKGGEKCIVRVEKQRIAVLDPAVFIVDRQREEYESNASTAAAWEKHYDFDYSYWSFQSSDPHYISQENVFDTLGDGCITNALQGYNCSIFAYGQTGSGKTYSMMGPDGGTAKDVPESELGLVPRMCRKIFELRGKASTIGPLLQAVVCSYMEVYNEQVFDLLVQPNGDAHKKHLKVREHPTRGVYVEGLLATEVHTYKDVELLLAQGGQMRTTAAHNLNNFSSRSHAVFQLLLHTTEDVQLEQTEGRVSEGRAEGRVSEGRAEGRVSEGRVSTAARSLATQRKSKVYLIDLAGSERAKSTGVTGERLREASNINRWALRV
jgi:kinesin family protein 1